MNHFPIEPYAAYAATAISHYGRNAAAAAPVAYVPNLSVAWDPSPRTVQSDEYDGWGYPSTPVLQPTPSELQVAAAAAADYVASSCDPAWCMLTVYAYTEFSEGGSLWPTVQDGYGRLDAFKAVFGNKTKGALVDADGATPRVEAAALTPLAPVVPHTPIAPLTSAGALPAMQWGAIRWDAFFNGSSADSVGAWTARVLQPEQWADRRPWYTYTQPDGNVTFDSNSPGVMDAEIALAVANGVDHWVFDVYPPTDPMSVSLWTYLNSTAPQRPALRFSLLLQASWASSGGLAAWGAKVALYASLVSNPSYVLALGNRPLIYLFSVSQGDWGGNATSGWRDWATALCSLASASVAAGRGAPYFVVQTWSGAQGAAVLAGINAAAAATAGCPSTASAPLISALSSYALPGATEAGTPWPVFADGAEAFWDSLAATGAHVIPPVAAGWDPRPRVTTPPPWCVGCCARCGLTLVLWGGGVRTFIAVVSLSPFASLPRAKNQDPSFVQMPTPEQMGALVQRAWAWSAAHPDANPAQLHLLSAWNEYDEGHFIGPVLPEFGGASRLEGIGSVLRPAGTPCEFSLSPRCRKLTH